MEETKFPIAELDAINRNKNGDYYFIFKVQNVKNYINVKGTKRNELLIVGVPQKQLKYFLKNMIQDL